MSRKDKNEKSKAREVDAVSALEERIDLLQKQKTNNENKKSDLELSLENENKEYLINRFRESIEKINLHDFEMNNEISSRINIMNIVKMSNFSGMCTGIQRLELTEKINDPYYVVSALLDIANSKVTSIEFYYTLSRMKRLNDTEESLDNALKVIYSKIESGVGLAQYKKEQKERLASK